MVKKTKALTLFFLIMFSFFSIGSCYSNDEYTVYQMYQDYPLGSRFQRAYYITEVKTNDIGITSVTGELRGVTIHLVVSRNNVIDLVWISTRGDLIEELRPWMEANFGNGYRPMSNGYDWTSKATNKQITLKHDWRMNTTDVFLSFLSNKSSVSQTEPDVMDIAEVQTLLQRVGYDIGPIDGIKGAMTIEGILQFQKSKGLKNDGVVRNDTREALLSAATALYSNEMGLGGLMLKGKVSDAYSKYSNPVVIKKDRYYILDFNGLYIGTNDISAGDILKISTKNPIFKTPRGIGVGNDLNDLLLAYSEPAHKDTIGEKLRYTYYPIDKIYYMLYITINKSSNKIDEIEILFSVGS